MRRLQAVFRLLHAFGLIVQGWWIIRSRFARLSEAQRATEVQRWAGRMLQALGVRLVVQGEPPAQGPLLLVSNHVSWLDILALHAARHVRFVSKSAVRHWPGLGRMSSAAGTLYIERESRRDAMRVVHHMTEALRAGDLLAVFPEGTTGDGRVLLPFHANLLQAAISAGAPVLPVALRFVDAASGQTSFAPRYVLEDHLPGSLWRTLSAPPLAAIVRFGQPQDSHGRERREWAQALHADVLALRDAAQLDAAEAGAPR